MTMLVVGIGGFAGAIARFWVGKYFARRFPTVFPWGTLAANVSGALLLGLLTGLMLTRATLPPTLVLGATTGFLGAYTTFSTWTLETALLADRQRKPLALLNVGLSVALGLLAAAAGLSLGLGL